MPRIQAPPTNSVPLRAQPLLEAVHNSLGIIPNMVRTMALSPAVLEAYLSYGKALSRGSLQPALREQIALTVASINDCGYCAAAHWVLGQRAGVSEADLQGSLRGESSDAAAKAALRFARRLVTVRGRIDAEDIERVRQAGYSDAQILEIIAEVALNILTNYVNLAAGTELDFPPVEIPELSAAA